MLKKLALSAAIAVTAPIFANADTIVSGHLTELEASYLPNAAGFRLDAGYSGCAAGSYLLWKGPANDGNASVVPAGFDMLTAAAIGKVTVKVVFSSGCTVHFLYLLP